jgi:hypothetical protein
VPRPFRYVALIGAIGLVFAAGDVRAQTCDNEIALLAQQYALSTDLPKAQPEPGQSSGSVGVPPQDLAKSGGVVAPPDGARGRVLDPPRQDDPMVTTPEVRPQTQSGESPSSEKTPRSALDAAQRAQMQGLLDAARAALKRGDEAECLDRVARARTIPEPG